MLSFFLPANDSCDVLSAHASHLSQSMTDVISTHECRTFSEVRRYLEATFGADHVISRGCERNWPSRLPDLTPVDYWFGGTLKARIFHYDKKFRTSFCNIAFKNECSRITVEELRNANSSFPRRVDLILQAGGRHFEYVL